MKNKNIHGFINCVKRRLPAGTPFNISLKYETTFKLHPTIKYRASTTHECNEIEVIIYSFGTQYDTDDIFEKLSEIAYYTGIKVNLSIRYIQ